MKRTLALITLLASLTGAPAQFYNLNTNLTQTNVVAASATLTYAGTNTFDARRYSTVGIVAVWSGSNTNTNTVTWSFQASPDGTNWEVLPRCWLVATNYGTNRVSASTNLDVRTAGWLRPFQVVNACTNSLTNVVIYGQAKEFLRN